LCRSKFVNDTFKAANRWIKLADDVHDKHFNPPSSTRQIRFPEASPCDSVSVSRTHDFQKSSD